MTDERQISKAVISRLPRYYRYLGELMEEGIERISSNELSARMKVTASQIRQDLNNFGGFGQQGYGYNVKYLYTEIARILGIDRQHNLIIIGAGNLGQAIANYTNFEKRGFMIKGMFDINPRLIGLVVRGVEIRGIDDLEQSVKAIQDLTISVHALAQDMRQMLSELKDQGSRLERFDGRLEALEQKPAKRWQRMSDKVLDTAVGILAGAVITGLAMLAVQYIK